MSSYLLIGLVTLAVAVQLFVFFKEPETEKMPSNIKLYYFDNIGRGEQIRMILDYGKIPFEDIRIPRNEWLKYKPIMPLHQLPVLEIDGEKIPQSIALCRYFAKKVQLAGNTEFEDLKIDSVVDTIVDLYIKLIDYHFEPDAARKEQLGEPLIKEKIPFYLQKFEQNAKENGGYLVLNRLTWADIIFINIYESLINWIEKDVSAEYPNLVKLKKNVLTVPSIKEHLQKRPVGPPFYDLKTDI